MKKLIFLFLFPFTLMAQSTIPFNTWVPTLPAATDLTGAYIPIIQGGSTKRAAGTLFAGSFTANAPLVFSSNILSIAQANGTTNGYLSSTDWTTFNNKQNAITLTTTGTSGAATFSSNTLNIPNYSPGGSNTQIQFNNSGSFGGSPNFTWSGTYLKSTGFYSSAASTGYAYLIGNSGSGPDLQLKNDNGVTNDITERTYGLTITGNSIFLGNGKSSPQHFVNIASSSGVPSAPAKLVSGYSPISYDTTAAALYVYSNGSWHSFSSGPNTVTSVFGRTGAIVAAANDYSFSQISGIVGSTQGGAGTVNGILKANGSGTVSAAIAGIEYVATESDPLAWKLASGGTLTGSNTITSNTMGWLNYAGTATATANNQVWNTTSVTLNSRAVASDNITSNKIANSFGINSTNINAVGIDLSNNYNQTGPINSIYVSTQGGSGMTPTIYTGVSATSTSGAGISAVFSVTVNTATSVGTVTATTPGTGYKVNDLVTFNASLFGGSGTITCTISSVSSIGIGTSASVLRLGINGANFNQSPKFIDFFYTGVSIGSIAVTSVNQGRQIGFYDDAGLNFYISNSSGAVFTKAVTFINSITFSSNLTQTASGNYSSSYGFPSTSDYKGAAFYHTGIATPVGDNIKFSTISSLLSVKTGVIKTLGAITGGTGYVNGTYTNVPLTGGSGSGAVASSIVVSGGAVTSVTLSSNGHGINYLPTDLLSASASNLGGSGSGLSIPISAIDYANNVATALTYATTQTDNTSANIYAGLYNVSAFTLGSNFTGKVATIWSSPTITNTSSTPTYNFVHTRAGDLGGIGTSSPGATWDIRGNGSTYPALRVASGGTSTEYAFRVQQSDVTTDIFTIQGNGNGYLKGVMQWGTNSTGSGSATLGSNSPATILTAPYTWIQMISSDGTTVYVPAWK